jgi:hypothetical protein
MASVRIAAGHGRWRIAGLALALAGAGAAPQGCGPSVAKLNGQPDHYYGETLTVTGRVGDYLVRDDTAEAAVFQLIASGGHRVLVVAPPPGRFPGRRRVRVRGEFVAERTVGGRTFYDVVSATSVKPIGLVRRMLFF